MRRYIIIIIALYPLLAFAAGDTLRILCIGNSFSVDAVEQELLPLAEANGVTLIAGNLYIGGCSLERHANNIKDLLPAYSYRDLQNGCREVHEDVRLNDALRFREWDIVTMQQASHYSGQWETYEPWLGILIDSVKTILPHARLAWHMTWAYSSDSDHGGFRNYGNNQQQMYAQICACTKRVMTEYPFDILIPVGTAIQNGRKTSLGDTFCRDGFHLNLNYGRYLAACVWLEALTGIRPHNTGSTKILYYGSKEPLTVEDSRDIRSRCTERLCRSAAHKAINKPL